MPMAQAAYAFKLFNPGGDPAVSFGVGELERMWFLLSGAGLAEVVFYDGRIRCVGDFVEYFSSPENHVYGIYLEGEPGGLAWLNGHEGRSARVHFTSLSPRVYREHAVPMGRCFTQGMLNASRGGEYVLDVLVGVTPSDNRLALRFIRRLGFARVGEVPHALWLAGRRQSGAAVVSYLTRELLPGPGRRSGPEHARLSEAPEAGRTTGG